MVNGERGGGIFKREGGAQRAEGKNRFGQVLDMAKKENVYERRKKLKYMRVKKKFDDGRPTCKGPR